MRFIAAALAVLVSFAAQAFDRPPANVPAPTLSLAANPTTIAQGESSTIAWNSPNASTCRAAGGGQTKDDLSPSGSMPWPFTATTTISMQCFGTGGASPVRSVTVTVTTAPPADSDGDGVPDGSDACPTVPASTPDGCPAGDPPPPPPPSGGSYRGIPDPNAALGFDVRGSYAIDRVVTGSQGQVALNGVGTASDPYVIDATGATFVKLGVTGSYVILQGGKVNAQSGSGPHFGSQCNRCVFRDVEVSGPKVDNSHSSAVALASFNVWLRGSIHGFGDNRQNAREQDYHGTKPIGVSDVWILESEIYDNSGDSVQVGDASRGRADRIYIGGNYLHHNRENAVDVKDSANVVISGNRMEGFRPTSSSPGEAIILHDDAVGAKVYDNVISDSTIGIVSSGLRDHVIDGNSIQALSIGIDLRNTRPITVTNNTITAPTRIRRGSGVTGTVQP